MLLLPRMNRQRGSVPQKKYFIFVVIKSERLVTNFATGCSISRAVVIR